MGKLIEEARARRDIEQTKAEIRATREQVYEAEKEGLYLRELTVSRPDYDGYDSYAKIREDRELLNQQYEHEFSYDDQA